MKHYFLLPRKHHKLLKQHIHYHYRHKLTHKRHHHTSGVLLALLVLGISAPSAHAMPTIPSNASVQSVAATQETVIEEPSNSKKLAPIIKKPRTAAKPPVKSKPTAEAITTLAPIQADLPPAAEPIATIEPEPVVAAAAPTGPAYVDGTQYPYAGAAWPNAGYDPWGMMKRQCVSYAAWKVAASGRSMPNWGGHGNAKLWDDNARADGIPVDTIPRVGDVAVSNAGTYGHVMYVEAVNGDGTIEVSQYNADFTGTYSTATKPVAGLVFIHFP